MNASRRLLPPLTLLAAVVLGCSSSSEEKAPADGKPPPPVVQVEPPKEEGHGHDEGPPPVLGDPIKNEHGKLMIPVVTPQKVKVYVAADHDPWADRVVSFKPGKPFAPKNCSDPQTVVGKPDYGTKHERKTCLAMGHGGELVLEFVDNRLFDGHGDDLVVFEVGPVVEEVDIAISVDGKAWIEVGQLRGAKCTADIGPAVRKAQEARTLPTAPAPEFRFVKITDARKGRSNNSGKPGADLDAVGALNSIPAPK
jgi:hypothetical protein